MCYVAAFEKRGGRETLLACDFGVVTVTLVPPLISHVYRTPLQERNRPLLVDHILVGGKRHGSGCAPGSGSLRVFRAFSVSRREVQQSATCRSLFLRCAGQHDKPPGAHVSAGVNAKLVCILLLLSQLLPLLFLSIWRLRQAYISRHKVDASIWGYGYPHCGAPLSVPGLMFEFHYFACVQVMSMVPDTNLDAKCFEDAPVPVEEREFQING